MSIGWMQCNGIATNAKKQVNEKWNYEGGILNDILLKIEVLMQLVHFYGPIKAFATMKIMNRACRATLQ